MHKAKPLLSMGELITVMSVSPVPVPITEMESAGSHLSMTVRPISLRRMTAPNLCPGHISPKKCDKSLTTWKMGVKEVSPLRYTLKSHPWGGFSFDSLES